VLCKAMRLREHPFMSYRGYPMWPPIWVGMGPRTGESPQGEIGHLREVRCYPDKPRRVFLVIDHDGSQYTGCLLFDDSRFSEQICNFLKAYYGTLTSAIGDLEIPPFLEWVTTYRKASDGQTWHFCSNCSYWPEADYEEQAIAPGTGEFCNQCKALLQEQRCR
jgi:hypothetical protein